MKWVGGCSVSREDELVFDDLIDMDGDLQVQVRMVERAPDFFLYLSRDSVEELRDHLTEVLEGSRDE